MNGFFGELCLGVALGPATLLLLAEIASATEDPSAWPTRIAYRVHGDGFSCFKGGKMFALQWRATATRGHPWHSRNLFTMIPHKLCIGGQRMNTLRHAAQHFVAMLNILHTGRLRLRFLVGLGPARLASRPCYIRLQANVTLFLFLQFGFFKKS